MTKSANAFRTISEVADWLDTETHVLRFWESKFSQIKPVKRAGGRRYYRPKDMLIIGGIKKLLHEDGITIKGTQRIIKDKGLNYISELSRPLETAKAEITQVSERIHPKTGKKSNESTIEEESPRGFKEIDGQFSMFSDELMTKPVQPLKSEATYESVLNDLHKKILASSDKDLFTKILNSIDIAIKKRA